jgi:pilus assembly protein TadC
MRAAIILVLVAILLLGSLAYAAFHLTMGLEPLPLAARGAMAAAILGALSLFILFTLLQQRQRRRDREKQQG